MTGERGASPATVVFACVENAGRSQIAAAFFNALADLRRARATSAGTRPAERVHAEVVRAMEEVGLDLGSVRPRPLTPELANGASLLVTMGCETECPTAPGVPREEWALDDPRGRPPEEVRRIREDVRRRVLDLVSRRGWREDRPMRRTDP